MLKALRRLFAGQEPSLERARELQNAGELRQALAACREALDRGAPAGEAHFQLGVLHAGLAEHQSAVEHLEKAIAHAPRDADAVCMLGAVMSNLRRFDEAMALFERALALRADFAEAHFNLGLAKFERADFAGAARAFARCVVLNRGEPWDEARRADLGREPSPPFQPKDMGVNPVKLRHDCEQLEHLLGIGRLPPAYREVLEDYRALLRETAAVPIDELVAFDPARHPLVARTYKRPVLIAAAPPPPGPLINPALEVAAIQERYLGARPNIIAVDDLLTPQALAAVRRFCLESTIWNNIKPGYLGAYFFDGFCSELLLRLAWELRETFPRMMRGLPLQMMWGYKCDQTLPGLAVHADEAAVNVNFWITDDEANLDKEHGGLLVYPQDAPRDWGFTKFNKDLGTILRFLESVGAEAVRVPYRQNRAVIFDSDLFHATDQTRFREGYVNRRVNITLLYGLRSM